MPSLPVPISTLYVALYALLLLALSGLVSRQRFACQVVFGDGGASQRSAPLRRAQRAQGNAAEYLPTSMLLLLLCELAGMGHAALHGWGTALLLARISHAFGISHSEGSNHFRAAGAGFQFLYLLALPLWLLARLGQIL
jgi:uncharacterized protein